jgi:hypothetical protein
MRYLEPKFSVGSPGTQSYADNWERTFGKPKHSEFLEVPSVCADAPTAADMPADVRGCAPSADVSVTVTAGCETPGGSWQGAGGEGGVTGTPPPPESAEGGVSGFRGVKE